MDGNVEAVTGGGADIRNLGYAGTSVFSSHSSPAKAAANPTSPAPSSVLLNFLSLMQSLATSLTTPIDTSGIFDTTQRTPLYHTLQIRQNAPLDITQSRHQRNKDPSLAQH